MSQHTAGPWQWTWQEERTCYALKGPAGRVLEITKGLTPTGADQCLMAAAPDLLAFAEAFVVDYAPNAAELARWRAVARAAIAKAKGA
jgi:hypothetical protein